MPPRHGDAGFLGFSRTFWIRAGVIAALFGALFWPQLRWLWLKTNPFFGESNWSHSIVVPIIGLYYLFTNRDRLQATPVRPSWAGLAILILGVAVCEYGIWPGRNQFVSAFGIVVALFGVVTLLCGWAIMRIAWFPIVFLVMAIPWTPILYSKVASPLQVLAARAAVFTLQATNVPAATNGATKIFIGDSLTGDIRTLNVAEACAGMRSLMTFISVAAAVAFLSTRPLWQKLVMTLSAVPIAIFCNVMRVAGQGLLDHYWSRELSEGFAHQFVGLVMLAPAFFMILLVGWLLDNLFIEEADKWNAPRNGKVRGPQLAGAGAPMSAAVLRTNPAARMSTPTNRPPTDKPAAPVVRASAPVANAAVAAPVAKPVAKSVPPTAKPAAGPSPVKPSPTTVPAPQSSSTVPPRSTPAVSPAQPESPRQGPRPTAPPSPVRPAVTRGEKGTQ